MLLVTGAVLVLCAERDRLPWGRPTRWVALALLAVAGTSGVLRPLPGTFEVVTITAGVVLVVAGWVELARRPEVGSWPLLGSGLVVALAPSLLLALTEDVPLRGVLLVVAAGAVLGWGAAGWQAPVLVAATVLAVHAVSSSRRSWRWPTRRCRAGRAWRWWAWCCSRSVRGTRRGCATWSACGGGWRDPAVGAGSGPSTASTGSSASSTVKTNRR